MKSDIMRGIPFLLALFLGVGCSGDGGDGGRDTDSETDTGTDVDSGTGMDAGDTDTGTGTGTDTDTGENEIPPELPDTCKLDIEQTAASEKDDWSGPDKGDGRNPDIGFGDSTLMAWTYFGKEEDASWEIQVASYDASKDMSPDGGQPDTDAGTPDSRVGPVLRPATKSPYSDTPAVAGRKGEFGVVWLDSRWDKACDGSDIDKCSQDIAFLRVDSKGQAIDGREPIRVTLDADIKLRPAIAATEKGYVVVWIQWDAEGPIIMARSLQGAGNLGAVQHVSTYEDVDGLFPVSVAGRGDKVVVVWATPRKQEKVLARTLNGDAVPQSEMMTVDEGNSCRKPRIASGSDGFAVIWGKQPHEDLEVFTGLLDANGVPTGEKYRATWTATDIYNYDITSNGSSYAIAWLSTVTNGSKECVVESCQPQVFIAVLDKKGEIGSVPVLVSKDPNPCANVELSWDGGGFTALWELPRNKRHQIFYGRIVCE